MEVSERKIKAEGAETTVLLRQLFLRPKHLKDKAERSKTSNSGEEMRIEKEDSKF